jgi:hypothetical protein
MKSKDFAEILRQTAELSGQLSVQQSINDLARAFDGSGATSVGSVLKRIAPIGTGQGIPTMPIVGHMKRVQALLRLAGKPAVTKDFAALLQIIDTRQQIEFSSPKNRSTPSAVRPRSASPAVTTNVDLVDDYNRALINTLGVESDFPIVYDKLKTDMRMRVGELHELARRFAGTPGKSKAEALKKIWNRHQNLVVSRAKDRATAGRSAA